MWPKSRNLAFVSVVVLAFVISSVRSEYTWNGSEWVWTESKAQAPPPSRTVEEEGSGGSYNNNKYSDYYEEDDDDTGFDDYDEGSGAGVESDANPYDGWNTDQQQRNNNNNYNSNNNNNNQAGSVNNYNNNYQDPYNANPVDPYGGRGQDNSQIYFTTSPPYFGNEVEKTDDIYVDPPMIPAMTTTTTVVPPKDPSISSRPKDSSRSTSFFAQPGTLAAVIGGAVVGLLCAILCVMFVVYRMRKKDEGSYALDEPKRSPTVNAYAKHPSREFYA